MATKEKSELELKKAEFLNNIPRGDEYEKMISGMLYDSFVPELEDARLKARVWMNKYNTMEPEDATLKTAAIQAKRLRLLRDIMGSVRGEDVFIEPPLRVDYGSNIILGDRFYANFNLTILDCAIITIGDRVMMGPNVMISAATHEIEVGSRRANIEYALPVTIGDDCWIGGGVIILPGVTIGKGCTIGAASVVTKDIPPWSVAVGSPARVIKKVPELDDVAN
ncbi:hypothetical protein S40285_05638 [Stachybotrys chlorohalonatus IBT 40285]|uniref:Maltose/galactoside acetyltransferase domain-containing protein n=1 Tax=Stachybotrys chlorohalonatus (strain IBT 40285) TaxID=1283841 RepID=A0A084QM48_STAC4|nr:hypothetical protein S40285_05638 [Stachybotrys chlorohalonata IBT 40285]